MTTPHQLKTPSGAGFSFMDLFSPKVANLISFGDQPNQADAETEEATRKKSGLEAYAKKNKQSLPSDFADQVLENEMDLEKDFVTLETVNKLTELYSLAMAFYESEGNHKYKYFANKLQDLLVRPNVKEMMMRELAPVKTKTEEKQVKRLRLENKISKINAEKEAFTVVKSQEYRDRELNKVLERNIQSQKDRIKQRLAEKKARSASRAQSVTYISDDNSSVADENAQDLEKELEGAPKINERPLLNDIAEVDETRYNTPPRKRTKDGHMIFFEKGKAQKTFKFDFDVEDRKPMKGGHARRHSYHKEPVVTVLAQKRTSRAQSFGNSKAPFPIENLKPLVKETDEKPLVARKETKNQTIVEDCNEGENKSLNSVESAGKNQPEEVVAHEEQTHNVESAVFLDEDEPSDHDEYEEEVAVQEVKAVEEQVVEEVQQQVANDQEEAVQEAQEVQEQNVEAPVEVETKEEEIQVEAEAEVQQEVEPVEAKQGEVVEETQTGQVWAEAEAKVEEQQVEAELVEAKQEEAQNQEIQVEAKVEKQQVEAEVQQEVEPVEAKQEVVEETQTEQVEAEAQQEEEQAETKQEVFEEVEAEVQQEEEQVQAEVKPVEAKEEEEIQAEINAEEQQVVEADTKEEKVQEEIQVEAKVEEQQILAEVEQEKEAAVEENKTENADNTEEVKEQPEEVAQVQEENVESPKEKKNRTRTDSELADEKKLELMRQIDAGQKELMDAFMKKQEEEREEITKKIEEKYEQKIQNMKEEMDEDEIAGDMWQRALKKFTKDKETEINETLEKLGQEQVQEYEKYKKKLLQQKMFKLAELSE